MSNPSMPDRVALTPSQEDYLLRESNKLNSEVEKLLEETRSREKYSLTIIAAVAVWIFTNASETDVLLLRMVSLIPILTTILFGFSVKYLYKNIKWTGIYLKRIEDYFLGGARDDKDNLWGWEKYFDSENKKGKFVRVTVVSWILQLLLAVLLFIFVCYKENFKIAPNADKCTHTKK